MIRVYNRIRVLLSMRPSHDMPYMRCVGALLLTFFLNLGLIFPLLAQTDHEVEDKVVVIEKDAKLELPVFNRNFERIIFTPEHGKPKVQEYLFTNVNVALPNITAKIRVPTIPPDPIPKLYGNYVKGGIGNYTTTYLEAFCNSKRSDRLNYGLHAKHLSSRNGPIKSKEVAGLSGSSLNSINVFLKYFLESYIVKTGIDFSTHKINYYGFDQRYLQSPILNLEGLSDSLRQRYNLLGIYGRVEDKDKTDQIGYEGGIRYNYLSSKQGIREGELLFDALGSYQLKNDQSLGAEVVLSLSSIKAPDKWARQFFQIKPFYNFRKDNVYFKVGINAAYSNDTIQAYNKLHFYPSLHTEVQVVEKVLRAFAGLDGELQKQTLRHFVQENPFLASSHQVFNSSKAIEFYIGGKGDIGAKVNYLGRISYAGIKNLYLYNNLYADTSRFAILYAQGNSSVFNFTLDFSYEITNKWRIGLSNKVYGYGIKPDSLLAWHRPNLVSTINTSYNLYDKIYFNADFFYIGGIKAQRLGSAGAETVKLPLPIDLNLKADYRVSQVFSAFVQFNNIFNKKYQLYQYYPVKGFNILAGVSYSF